MNKMRVGVLRGGPSSEYDVSLQTGANILKHLARDTYDPIDILIDRKGRWYLRGMEQYPERILNHLDVVIPAIYGSYLRGGDVQRLLHTHSIPYTGSDALASAVALNKKLTKRCAESLSIRTPYSRIVSIDEVDEGFLFDFFRTFPQPCVIKPIQGGSSIGISVAYGYEQLKQGFETASKYSDEMLVEEFVFGREVTCGVIDQFRNEDLYALPEVEIKPNKKNVFFDYAAKYNGESVTECPASFSRETKSNVAQMAKKIHKALGLRHYSRSDFIVSPQAIYFLEVNTHPSLTQDCTFIRSLEAVGGSVPRFLDHIVCLARAR